MEDKYKYLINFFILLLIIYLILKHFELEMAKLLAIIVGNMLNTHYFENNIVYNGAMFSVIPACTCSFEIALFLSYVFAAPKTPIKYKFIYSVFGLFVINVTNILRIIFIIKNSYLSDYIFIHNLISFIIFPVALILNLIWVKILIKLGVVEN